MPLRGENVGTAYVRIIADGSAVPEGIRDAMEDAVPVVRDAGAEHGGKYGDSFLREARKEFGSQKALGEMLAKSMERGAGRAKVTDAFFKSREWDRFLGAVERNYGAAGVLAAREMQNKFAAAGTLKGLEAEFSQFQSRITQASAKISDAQAKEQAAATRAMLDEAYTLNQQHNDRLLKDRLDMDKAWELSIEARARAEAMMLDEAYALNKSFNAKMRKDWETTRTLAAAFRMDEERTARLLKQTYDDLGVSIERMSKGLKVEGDRSRRDLINETIDLRRAMDDAGLSTVRTHEALFDMRRDITVLNPRLAVVNRNLTTFADRMGAAFGRGARNDFINLVGVFSRSIALLPRAFTGVYGAFDRFQRRGTFAFDSVREAGGTFADATRARLGSMAKDIGKLFAGIGGGIAGGFVFVGPLLSTINLAIGAVASLVSSLSFGLVGALGAASGAFLPLATGIGVVVAAFKNVPKEAKAAVDSIKKEFAGLGDLAGESVFSNVTEQASRFKDALGELEPVVEGVGLAISRVGDYFLDMMEGTGYKSFVVSMTDFLPGAVESLGRILVNSFGSLGGVFRGLIPLTGRFLGYLEDTTKRFNDFTNSATGVSKIAAFFKDAGDSAATLFDFLGSLSSLLGTIMSAGRVAGDSLFGSMTDSIDRWNATLRDNPDILKGYFDDAAAFGRAIGDLVVGVGQLWDVLDNDASRAVVIAAFETLAAVMETTAAVIGPVAAGFARLNEATGGLAGTLAAAALVFPRFNRALTTGVTASTGMVAGLRNTETRMTRLASAAKGAAGVGGLAAFTVGATASNDAVSLLAQTAGGALMGAAFGPAGALVGGVLGAGAALLTMSDNTEQSAQSFTESLGPAAAYATTLEGVGAAATQASRELAYMRLVENDLIGTAQDLGVSTRDLVSAMTGNEKAAGRVNAALDEAYANDSGRLGEISKFRTEVGGLTGEFEDQQQSARDLAAATAPLSELYKGFPKEVRTAIKATGGEIALTTVAGLNKEFDLTPKQISTLMKLNGVDGTVADVQLATRLYGKIPDSVITKVASNGTKESSIAISGLITQYDLTPKQVRTLIRIDGDVTAKQKARLVEQALEETANGKYKAKIDADGSPAERVTKAVQRLINQVMGDDYEATLDANSSPAERVAKAAQSIIKKVVNAAYVADIDGDPSGAQNASRTAEGAARGVANGNYNVRITGDASGVQSAVASANQALAALDTYKQIIIETVNRWSGGGKGAAGGMFTNSTMMEIGESGPELLVPLARPLGQVDPAVRALAAVAQGKALPGLDNGGNSKGVDASGWTIVTDGDPEKVAAEVLNRLVATTF